MNSRSPQRSLLLIGHGSSTDKRAEQSLYMHAEKIRKKGLFKSVFVDFLKNEEGAPQFGTEPLLVVPFFMSDGYFVRKKVPEQVSQRINLSKVKPSEVHYCPSIGTDAELADIILTMIQDYCIEKNINLENCQSVLLAHGSPSTDTAQKACLDMVDILAKKHGLNTLPAFLETEPTLSHACLQARKPSCSDVKHVLVLGMFAAEGPHVTEDIPKLLETVNSYHENESGGVSYVGTLGLHPAITALIEKSALHYPEC